MHGADAKSSHNQLGLGGILGQERGDWVVVVLKVRS
jgi:hypothetical protein